ncbi:hypothetical protein UlMin_007467, partial [Ulmus minor]
YKNDSEILAMTNLIGAYKKKKKKEILEFEKILKSNRRTIMDDPFIRNYIEDLLKNVRTQELNVPEKDVEQLIVLLILDNQIDGHIDQVNRLLERGDRFVFFRMKKYAAIDKWNTAEITLSNHRQPSILKKCFCNLLVMRLSSPLLYRDHLNIDSQMHAFFAVQSLDEL